MPLSVADLESLIRLLDEHPEWAEALQERLVNERTLIRLLEQRAELRDAARRLILQDELLQLPVLIRELAAEQRRFAELLQRHDEMLQRHDELLQQNTLILQQHGERIARLEALMEQMIAEQQRFAELLQRHDELLQRHDELLNRVMASQERLERDFEEMRKWREGEEGRRAGERFERQIAKRVVRLLNGGDGGQTDEPHVKQRLREWLQRLPPEEDGYPDEESDPTLADLIWWKQDQVAVVEVALKVNRRDVLRARQRADTLRRAGVDAIPIVIGEAWATATTKRLAEQNSVEWMLKGEVSRGVIEFRQLP